MRGGRILKRVRRDRRAAYFFVIDAFIAAAILSVTLVLIFNLFVGQTDSGQTFTYAHDFITFLAETEVRDYRHPTIANMVVKGDIEDPRKTLAEQVILDFAADNIANASVILNASAESLPATLRINVSILDPETKVRTQLYSQAPRVAREERLHLTARTLEYSLTPENQIIGPYILQVEVWS